MKSMHKGLKKKCDKISIFFVFFFFNLGKYNKRIRTNKKNNKEKWRGGLTGFEVKK
jgi:hypothetical protein